MPTLEFSPFTPWFCLTLALLAVPIALGVRRLGATTRHRTLPVGWAPGHAGLTALVGLVVLVGILLTGPLLEACCAHVFALSGMGESLGEPATWAAAGAAVLVWASLQAWRLLLLAWPLLWALGRVAEVRWAGPVALALGVAAALPLAAAGIVSAFPAPSPAHALAAALLLWSLPLQAWGALQLAQLARQRFLQWRTPPGEVTRVSPMPAALAAALQVGEGRTTGFVRIRRQ